MKRSFLLFSLLGIATLSQAQNSGRLYAFTGHTPGSFQWTSVEALDASTGKSNQLIFKRQATQVSLVDARTRQSIAGQIPDQEATGTMVAASAYDKANNRLYFTPMHGTDLRFFDLNASNATVGVVRNAQLKQFTSAPGEADVVTRMTFASDGFGYALTNDGNHLIRFSSGQNVVIRDLGALRDAPSNGQTSVHNQCSSWGGDMVGDAFGNLYLFTVKGLVFKITPATMLAELKGSVKGLANSYTINGAAVDAKGKVTLSSSTNTERYYSLDVGTLNATPMENEGAVSNASDLASGELLFSDAAGSSIVKGGCMKIDSDKAIAVFPNPVTTGQALLQLSGVKQGQYQVELLNANGQPVFATQAQVGGEFGQVPLNFGKKVLPGVYTVRVVGREGKQVHSERIVVQ